MQITMYQASVPASLHMLAALSAILDKAKSHCDMKRIEPQILVNYRLYPDMFPLSRQVQIACDLVKGMAARLGGQDVPSYPDTEQSFEELQARIKKTVDFIKSVPQTAIDGSEDKKIVIKAAGNELNFTGKDYLISFVLPNFYFHLTATYAILRHAGVELGKRDYLGAN
jgi:uncharacterized protein